MADQRQPRTITIVETAHGYFIHEGERYCPALCWDDMLDSLVELTRPAITGMHFAMLLPEEHAARRDRYRKRTAPTGLLREGPKP